MSMTKEGYGLHFTKEKINDGGPAYPCQEFGTQVANAQLNEGMSLRDYFAGQALASMLSAPDKITETTFSKAAELSYRFADAMIAERGKQ